MEAKMTSRFLTVILKSNLLFFGFRIFLKTLRSMEEKIRLQKGNTIIVDLQGKLVPLVQELHRSNEICFTSVPAVGSEDGNNWRPESKLEGQWVYEKFQEEPDFVIETSRRVADDYQKVTARAEAFSSSLVDVEEGRKWVFGSLLKWSGPIVETGYLDHREVMQLTEDFERVIKQKGKGFFGYAHGNTIGDHIFIGNNGTVYLFGMRIVLRPGKGYYDFLRALDWLLLKTPNDERTVELFIGWMKSNLSGENWDDVKLVFALRCIGILGWDMLHRGDEGSSDFSRKKDILLRFIRREY